MNTAMKIIDQREVLGKDFKIYGDFENPLFLAKDVAEWIEYDTSSLNKLVSNVDGFEKVRKIVPTLGGSQEMWFLTEDGLYEVLMQSRKPIAKQFKARVKEILKEIRRNGAYMTDGFIEKVLADPDIIIELATKLKASREKAALLTTTVEVQKQQISELTPKASYYDMVLNCKDLLSISQIAKDYGKSAKWMNDYLHEAGVQYRQSGVWLLYQKYASCGYTSTKTHSYNGNDGNTHAKVHTYWTQKGRLFIYETLKNGGILPLIEKVQ